MYKFCITRLHLGRYKVDFLDENNQIITGADGGSAFVMLKLSQWLFQPEEEQYRRDERASSNKLRDVLVEDMLANKEKYLPPKPKLIGDK